MEEPAAVSLHDGYDDQVINEALGSGKGAPVLIIAAHMDDEAIGAGGLLRYLENVSVLHITDGAARNMLAARARGFTTRRAYAEARGAELREALSRMKSAPMDLTTLDIPDLDGAHNLAGITRAVRDALVNARPAVVITHPYEGGHPDHDSAAFAAAAACSLLQRGGKSVPEVIEFTSYHGEGRQIVTSRFLPSREAESRVVLSDEDRTFKAEMFACYRTQKGALKNFPIFEERFRKAPAYDFLKPPHEGRLFYQYYDWGLPGRLWCSLAARAMHELGIGEGRASRSLSEMSPRAIYRYMKYLRTRTAL